MNQACVDWLLSFDEPSLQYRVKAELLDHKTNAPEMIALKAVIPNSEPVRELLDRMHPDGYWLVKDHNKKQVGDGVMYWGGATTHYVLSDLAELCMDHSDPRIEKAGNRYLDLQQDDGTWINRQSCVFGHNIHTFVKLGFRDDPRLQKTIDYLLSVDREDGGYLCDIHEKRYKRKVIKSCIRGTSKVLLAYSVLPEYWEHVACQRLVQYYFEHEILWKISNPEEFINRDVPGFHYPFGASGTFWEPIYVLSKMGYGNHPKMKRAWDYLASRLDELGRATLDYTPAQAQWKVGKRGEPNPWLTLYAQLAMKYKNMQLHSTENVG